MICNNLIQINMFTLEHIVYFLVIPHDITETNNIKMNFDLIENDFVLIFLKNYK